MNVPVRTVGALLCVLSVSPMAIAQQAGRVFNPVANPSNPNLIAFERLEGDRRELNVLNAATGQTTPARAAMAAAATGLSLPDIAGGSSLSGYSGDIDWSLVTSDGKTWFAYIANDERGLHLNFNAIDASGRLSLAQPMRLTFNGNVRSPRWSADGRHLAFVSDSGFLFIIPNASDAVRASNVARMQPARVSTPGTSVLFPAWSPTGDNIAYQAEKNVRGARRFAIDVVPVDPSTARVLGPPVTITESLSSDNEYRPSWSPGDGKYIAFYIDRNGQGGADAQVLDIGIVEPQKNPMTKRIFRGEVREGISRRLAEGVIPNASRGPAWTRIAVGQTPQAAVVYVAKDEARNNPILVSVVDAWMAMRQRDDFTLPLSSRWGTSNHKDVSASEMQGQTRYVYASVEGGGENIHFKDEATPWANGKRPVVMANNAAPSGAQQGQTMSAPRASSGERNMLAILDPIPGVNQMSNGHTGKGVFLFTTAAVGVGMGLFALHQHSESKSSGVEQGSHASRLGMAVGGAALATGAWIVGVMDGLNSSDGMRVSAGLAPAQGPRSTTVEAKLGLTLPIGSRGR